MPFAVCPSILLDSDLGSIPDLGPGLRPLEVHRVGSLRVSSWQRTSCCKSQMLWVCGSQKSVVLKVGPPNQQQQHPPGTYYECKLLGPTPDLLIQKLWRKGPVISLQVTWLVTQIGERALLWAGRRHRGSRPQAWLASWLQLSINLIWSSLEKSTNSTNRFPYSWNGVITVTTAGCCEAQIR